MGEKIIFPKNYEQYVKKAVEAFQQGKMEESLPFFKEAYQLKQEEKINTFYTTALYQTGNYQEAKAIAEDKLTFYENEEQLYAFYVSILIRGHYFIQAEAIIKKQLHRKDRAVERITWQSLMSFSKEEQKTMQIKEEKRVQDILKRSAAIADKSFQEQSLLLSELESIPIKDYIKASKLILNNPYVNGLIKTSLLERLVSQKVDEELTLYWFEEERMINPINLLPIKDNQKVNDILQLLEEELEIDNPTLYEVVRQEATVHFILLYPFIDEVIKDPKIWVHLYRKNYELMYQEGQKNGTDFSKDEKWMNRLNQLMTDFTKEI